MSFPSQYGPRLVGRRTRIIGALASAGFALFCLLIVLTSGAISPDGDIGWLSFAVIDCSNIETQVENKTFRGLPDANDFSKHKDFYALYLWTYCSGHVSPGGTTYSVNFCAKSGTKSLYNLYRYWSVWGSQVHKDGTRFFWLEHGPEGIYIAYLAAAFFTGAAILLGYRSMSTHHVGTMTVFISSLSFASVLMTAAAVQFTYGQLLTRTEEPDMGTGSRKHGHAVYILNWLAVASALVSFALWSHLSARNTIRRAPTLDTKGMHKRYQVGETTGADSPIMDSSTTPKPIRRRTLLSTVDN